MRRKKKEWELPGEMRIVLECSQNLEPCKKFPHANIFRFAEYFKERKCQQYIDFFVQADKELKTMQLLTAWRKSRNNRIWEDLREITRVMELELLMTSNSSFRLTDSDCVARNKFRP